MNHRNETIWGGIIAALVTTILAILIFIACKQDQANKDRLNELHAGELSACWQEVQEKGGICRIEYLKDRTDTVYGARVIREAE